MNFEFYRLLNIKFVWVKILKFVILRIIVVRGSEIYRELLKINYSFSRIYFGIYFCYILYIWMYVYELFFLVLRYLDL